MFAMKPVLLFLPLTNTITKSTNIYMNTIEILHH